MCYLIDPGSIRLALELLLRERGFERGNGTAACFDGGWDSCVEAVIWVGIDGAEVEAPSVDEGEDWWPRMSLGEQDRRQNREIGK